MTHYMVLHTVMTHLERQVTYIMLVLDSSSHCFSKDFTLPVHHLSDFLPPDKLYQAIFIYTSDLETNLKIS